MKITRLLLLSTVFMLPVMAQTAEAAPAKAAAKTSAPAPAAAPITQTKVQSIAIKGNQRVDTESVKSYLAFSQGADFSDADLNKSIKALFSTGLYSDVNISEDNGNIEVDVVENPIISQVAFEGNEGIEDDKLSPEVTLKSRSIYTKAAVQEDVQRLANIYRKSGRFNAEIVPKVILKDQNRVDLIFEINEGAVTRIKKVNFIGNSSFSDEDLKAVVRSAEEAWYNILSSDDSYDPERIEYDKELLRRYYAQNGYADFHVESAIAEQTLDEDGFILTFSIDEGTKYQFGDVNVFSTLEDLKFDAKDDELIRTKKGKVYDETRVEKTVENLIEEAGKKGYAFVDVEPQTTKNKETKKLNIDFIVNEGPKVYVDKIKIHGNQRTLDSVIRREFRLAEGDPYNSELLKRSKQRVDNLDFFEKVDVKREQGSAPDKVDIDVAVKEKSTGALNFGAGFSTTEGVLGDVSVTERNFLGRGQNLGVSVSASTIRQQGQISFTEPYFLDQPFAAGFDVFKTTIDQQDQSSYKSDSVGFNLRGGYEMAEHVRHNVKYSLSDDNITDIDPAASTYIKEQAGQHTTSMVGQTFMIDYRDNIKLPRDGYVARLTEDLAGLGGDSKFIRHGLQAAYYYPLTEDKDWFLTFNGEGGNVTAIGGESVPVNNRYFIGGSSFRGFSRSGIGPRDAVTGDALGGNNYYKLTSEVGFPIGINEEFGLTGAFFTDFGSLWGAESKTATIVDSKSPRLTVGFGLGWSSPFGPLRVDFGFPIVKDDVDETEAFQLNFGTNF